MFITRTSLYCCIFTAISRILVVVVVVVVAVAAAAVLEHNQHQTRHDICAFKFDQSLCSKMGSTFNHRLV